MRLPARPPPKTKVSSPLVHGSFDSNDSDPIDIDRRHAIFDTTRQDRSISDSYLTQRRSSKVGSFVGSYEESILNGRMSQTPSKPVDFTASIGVLGKGKCKPSLKCPPHLTLPFPAFFYSDISPYVGQIDVDVATKHGYRVPAQGQLQIIIKNPNNAAVKLFLIPYDVSDMPASSKTFFRQKHYDDDKLRYAIHIQICCPAEGKYYITKTQRVVFANRVPDGKEHLRITIQSPEPRYTPWVPEKKQLAPVTHSREPRFIGGSLLDRERSEVQEFSDAPSAFRDISTHLDAISMT